MTAYFGLGPQGFIPKKLSQIQAEIYDALKVTFGANLNLDARSLFGQLCGVFAEREALLWELAEALYQSQYPGGAEGTAVDNILALTNLRRLGATAGRTNPNPVAQQNGLTLHGLVLYGNAGTVIPRGSVIRSNTLPSYDFLLDADVVISPAQNAAQTLLFSQTPDAGALAAVFTNPATGHALSLTLPYNTQGALDAVSVPTSFTTGSWYLMLEGALSPVFSSSTNASSVQTWLRSLSGHASTLITGAGLFPGFQIDTQPGVKPLVRAHGTRYVFSAAPTGGEYVLNLGASATSALAYDATAAQVEAALQALGAPYSRVRVAFASGSTPFYAINWGEILSPPLVTVSGNTTGKTITVLALNQTGRVLTVVDSLQTALNNLRDGATRPFTDVVVTTGFQMQFGAQAPAFGEAPSGEQGMPLVEISANTLTASSSLVSVAGVQNAEGAEARGIGTATGTELGPKPVLAGQLCSIGTPVTGWASVTNDLDILQGTAVESDAEALARRSVRLAGQQSGPLQAIVERVAQVDGVTSVAGLENTSNAAVQLLTFSAVPTTGAWQLYVPGLGTASSLAYNATARQVQAALRALPGLSPTWVSGNPSAGLTLDFNGSLGGQPIGLVTVVANTTGTSITPAFARPPKSFEIVVQGGKDAEIARAIFDTSPAGIPSFGASVQTPLGNLTAGSAVISVDVADRIEVGLAAFGQGLPPGAQVVLVSGTDVTLSSPVSLTATAVPLLFNHTVFLADAGNLVPLSYTRPTPMLVYVTIGLVTDTYRIPGDSTSGLNPNKTFQPASMVQIQRDVVALGNRIPPGGRIIGLGTQGLFGAFNEVAGVVNYALAFGLSPSPTALDPIELLVTQAPSFQTFNVQVFWT